MEDDSGRSAGGRGGRSNGANRGIYACIAMHHPSFVGETKGHRRVRYLCCFAYGRLKTWTIGSSQPAISRTMRPKEFHHRQQFVRIVTRVRNVRLYETTFLTTVTTSNARVWQRRGNVLGYVGTSIEFHWERSGMKAM